MNWQVDYVICTTKTLWYTSTLLTWGLYFDETTAIPLHCSFLQRGFQHTRDRESE